VLICQDIGFIWIFKEWLGGFNSLFGAPPRDPASLLTSKDMDLAASIQAVTEEVVLRLTRDLAKNSQTKNLCLAGGVALNCVANGKLVTDGSFENIWIQPAAGDAGGSLGAAFCGYHQFKNQPRKNSEPVIS
jgi:carbamoyltransferase